MRCLDDAVKEGYVLKTTKTPENRYDYISPVYTPLKDVFFMVSKDLPSREGCIGKLVTCSGWDITLQFSDDVIKTFGHYRVDMLPLGGKIELKWHFNRNNKPKITPRKNKFDQELEKGLLIVGAVGRITRQNCLMFGHITRWTEQTVWIEPYGNFADAKWMRASVTKANNDIKLIDFNECFVIEETDDLKSQLLIQILRS